MKIKSILFPILTALILSSSTACGEKEIPPFFTIDTKTVNFDAAASARNISVETNVTDWTATVQSDAELWLKAESGNNALQLTVSANEDLDTRKAEVTVVAGNITETITVEQMGTDPAILVSPETVDLTADGGEFTIEVTSNVAYEVIIPEEAAWIKENPEVRSGEMVTNVYVFTSEWNADEEERQANIIVSQIDGDLEKTVPVTQAGQGGYSGGSGEDIKDDIKVPVHSATATSYQSGGEIELSYDDDYATMYHSKWDNSADNYFPITLDYNFEGQESIDYLIYYPRTSGSNGHFKEVEIWVATEADPELKKLSDHDFKGSGSATKILFEESLIQPKTIRFVVNSGAGDGQGFASCSEMEFYRTNPDNFDPLQLFTDLTCTELKPGITEEDIKQVSVKLYRDIALYLYRDEYPGEFRIQEYKAWPHPDTWASQNKTSTLSLLDNPTGMSVKQDEELIAFVGDTHGYTLSIKIQDLDTPGADGYGNASTYSLSEGVNKIVARNKGLVYLFYHTEDYETAPPVTVHFATGTVNGYYDSQKHDEADWDRLLSAASDKYFDVLGEYAHLTFETDAFRSYTVNDGPELIAAYDELVRLEEEFMGLMKYDRPGINRVYFHVMYSSYMYATSYRTAYESATQQGILTLQTFKSTPWGPAHEVGHIFQTRPGFRWLGMTEVTNNVHSLYVQTQWGNSSRIETEDMGRYNNRYENAYNNSFVKNTPHPAEADVFCKLVSLWQLQLYFANAKGLVDTYKDLYELVRTSPDKSTAGEQQLEFVKMVCEVTQTDLTEFFTRWGYLSPYTATIDDYGSGEFVITQDQVDQVIEEIAAENYPPMTEKIEYICDSNWEIYKNKSSVQQGTASKNGSTITMYSWQNVVAYEVYENDELVFVSNRNSFTLDNAPTNNTVVKAVAYDGSKTTVTF